jgi:hypothetical protein
MSTTIEERVAILEKELTSLKQVIQSTLLEKDWRKTCGMSANDPGFDDMIRLGREIRLAQLHRQRDPYEQIATYQRLQWRVAFFAAWHVLPWDPDAAVRRFLLCYHCTNKIPYWRNDGWATYSR